MYAYKAIRSRFFVHRIHTFRTQIALVDRRCHCLSSSSLSSHHRAILSMFRCSYSKIANITKRYIEADYQSNIEIEFDLRYIK